MDNSSLSVLYGSLSNRARPEEVARILLELLGYKLDHASKQALGVVADAGWGYSFMSATFEKPISLDRSVNAIAAKLDLSPLTTDQARDPQTVRAFLDTVRIRMGMSETDTDFLANRRNRAVRKQDNIEVGRRTYNKVFRLTNRLANELTELEHKTVMSNLSMRAKSGFATLITWEDFSSSSSSAALVAYMCANLNRRSIFTNTKQARAFDDIAKDLFGYCEKDPTCNWKAIAHVFPRADVLAHLSSEEKMELLGIVFEGLTTTGTLLRKTASSGINYSTMIVKRGNDSSSWNALAGSWNKSRDYYFALLESLGLESTLDAFMPGKVLRLMAADVAYWHSRSKGDLHADSKVFALLPKPWEVLLGDAACSRELVERVCRENGIDPQKSGWSRARSRSQVEAWRPTPELVHGVEVSNPYLAKFLRKVGVFSGYPLHESVLVKAATPEGRADILGFS